MITDTKMREENISSSVVIKFLIIPLSSSH